MKNYASFKNVFLAHTHKKDTESESLPIYSEVLRKAIMKRSDL